ncbi:hypothetical protein MVEN_01925000 [Mycena venus]|uniref:Uncharacterized protein n=1 Tax=Mycena venus TaxID=2733690 RepID=A0A8H6XGL4_9AGAR|nr:hypothetical protein MVEN_01925000 [Mycena venus]
MYGDYVCALPFYAISASYMVLRNVFRTSRGISILHDEGLWKSMDAGNRVNQKILLVDTEPSKALMDSQPLLRHLPLQPPFSRLVRLILCSLALCLLFFPTVISTVFYIREKEVPATRFFVFITSVALVWIVIFSALAPAVFDVFPRLTEPLALFLVIVASFARGPRWEWVDTGVLYYDVVKCSFLLIVLMAIVIWVWNQMLEIMQRMHRVVDFKYLSDLCRSIKAAGHCVLHPFASLGPIHAVETTSPNEATADKNV